MTSNIAPSRIWTWLKSPGVMAVVTFFSIALAIYLGFFYEKRPMLVGTVNSLSPVFDVLRPVGGLDISYGGVNLREAKKSLWSVDLTFRNEGNAGIRRDDFDPNAPVQIAVKDAQVVDRPSVATSNEYLTKNVKITAGANEISISPAIIEPGDTITINFLVLGAEAVRPRIAVMGKIAGMKTIPLMSSDTTADGKSWWGQIVGADSIWIQLIRAPIYFFAFFFEIAILALLVAAVTNPFSKIRDAKERRARAEEIRKLRRESLFDQRENSLADEYIENGIASVAKIAKEAKKAQAIVEACNTIRNGGDDEAITKAIAALRPPMSQWAINRLSDLRLITVEDGKPVGVSELNSAVRNFCQKIGKNPDDLIKQENGARLDDRDLERLIVRE